jgi:DNA anti-recombination protein RmuC
MDSEQYKSQIDQLNKSFNKNVNVLKNKMNRLINTVKRLNLSPSIKKQYINRYVSRYNISVQALKNSLSATISSLVKNRKFAFF